MSLSIVSVPIGSKFLSTSIQSKFFDDLFL